MSNVDDPGVHAKTDKNEDSVNEKIINAVKIRTVLWDMTDKLYHDNPHKKKTWAEAAYILDMSEVFIKTRWKSLRDRYSKELKKAKPKSGQGAFTTEGWAHMKAMSFLSGIVEPRRTTTNMNPTVLKTVTNAGDGSAPLQTVVLADLNLPSSSAQDYGTQEDIQVLATQTEACKEPVEISSPILSSVDLHAQSRPSAGEFNVSNSQAQSTKLSCGKKRNGSTQPMSHAKMRNVDNDPLESAIISLMDNRQNGGAQKEDLTPEDHFYLSISRDVQQYNLLLRIKMRQAVLGAFTEIFGAESA